LMGEYQRKFVHKNEVKEVMMNKREEKKRM
jgi:hypothetical protein